jgi:hypothetical protein
MWLNIAKSRYTKTSTPDATVGALRDPLLRQRAPQEAVRFGAVNVPSNFRRPGRLARSRNAR